MTAPNITHYISGGATRCVQASFRMILETYQGSDIGEARADDLTGYIDGRGTWQFRMLLAFANFGFNVIDHENFDFGKFIIDPKGAIQDQTQDDHVTNLIMAETDIPAETAAVHLCINSPRINLIRGIPTFDDVIVQIMLGRLVMCNVNLQVLEGRSERAGHILIPTYIDNNVVIAHDPGPHGSLNRSFCRDLFESSWTSPAPTMANYISVWP